MADEGDFLFISCIIIIKNTCVITNRDSGEIHFKDRYLLTTVSLCRLMRH